MSDRVRNWMPGVPPEGLNGADLDTGSVVNGALAGSVTSDKLSKPYAPTYLTVTQLAPAVTASGLFLTTISNAGIITYVGAAQGDAGTGAATGIIDVLIGDSETSTHSVFGSGSKVALSATDLVTFTNTPSGLLGVVDAGDHLRVEVDQVTSGTKAQLSVTVGIKQLLIA